MTIYNIIQVKSTEKAHLLKNRLYFRTKGKKSFSVLSYSTLLCAKKSDEEQKYHQH
jgi:hypothetical protein